MYEGPRDPRGPARRPSRWTPSTQLFSGTNYVSLFFGGCPTKNGLPQTGFPFFPGVIEQLSPWC